MHQFHLNICDKGIFNLEMGSDPISPKENKARPPHCPF